MADRADRADPADRADRADRPDGADRPERTDAETVDARLAVEYRNARLRLVELVAAADAATVARTVPACPDWSVHELLSHVTGIAADLGSARYPEGGDTQAWVDRQIAERRARETADVAAEWGVAGPVFEALIEAKPHRWWGLTYDAVVHEHDVRGALGDAGARDSDGVRVAAELGLRIVATDLAKHGLPAFRAVVDGREHVVGEGAPELTLEGSAFDVLRLLGSRRTLAEMRAASFTGDLDRYLPALAHMPLPDHGLGE
jgi:uncharacterized protein (TIGR03083 family)